MSEAPVLIHPFIGIVPREGESLSPRSKRPDYKIDPDTGCWNWLKTRVGAGYGTCSPAGYGAYTAHRAYYKAAYGVLPKGAHVHHRCENPSCVNPAHLEAKLPVPHLTDHKQANSHLNWDDVAEIRRRYVEDRAGVYELADEFGIGKSQAHNIVTNRKWIDPEYVPGRRTVCGLEDCGVDFIATRRQQRFCSRECRVQWNSRRSYLLARARNGVPLDAPVREYRRAA